MKTLLGKIKTYLGEVRFIESARGFNWYEWRFFWLEENSPRVLVQQGTARSFSAAWDGIFDQARRKKVSYLSLNYPEYSSQTSRVYEIAEFSEITPDVSVDSYSNGRAIVSICSSKSVDLTFKDSMRMGQKNGVVIEFRHEEMVIMAEALRQAATKLEEDFIHRVREGIK